MTKDEYLRDKMTKQINIHAAWEMYMDVDHPMPKLPITEFMHLFPTWARTSRLDHYWAYYDKKFEL